MDIRIILRMRYRLNNPIEIILDKLIERKRKKLSQLNMENTQDNYKLVMLQNENSKRQQSQTK